MFYLTIILSGYLSTFDDTPDIVVKRNPPPNFKKDYFLSFAQIAVAAALCITIPINFIALRTEIYNLFLRGEKSSTRG